MFLALISGQRCQTLHALDLKDCMVTRDRIKCIPSAVLKTSKVNKCQPEIVIYPWDNTPELCVFNTLLEYLQRTRTLRGQTTQLFISFIQPHGPITKASFSRWIKTLMSDAGVNTDMFKAHSVRAATTSKAYSRDIPLETILRTANWTRSSTFEKNSTINPQKHQITWHSMRLFCTVQTDVNCDSEYNY